MTQAVLIHPLSGRWIRTVRVSYNVIYDVTVRR
jgi:hypothetical protein